MTVAAGLLLVISILAVPTALTLYVLSRILKWPEARHWSKWGAVAGVVGFVIGIALAAALSPGTPNNESAVSSAPANAPGARPSYCGGRGTERLPECGWTADKQAAVDKQEQVRKDTIKDSEACGIAKEFVTAALKAPATASFPWSCNAGRAGDKWEVKGHVDSQNSFGATIRSYYTVTVRPAEWRVDRWHWDLLAIRID